MTTKVIVEACCGDDTEVKVVIKDNGSLLEIVSLQDGENTEQYVYDDREIIVKEIKKSG